MEPPYPQTLSSLLAFLPGWRPTPIIALRAGVPTESTRLRLAIRYCLMI
jgi:hypothetical protein